MRLDRGHEERGGKPLARDIGHDEEQAPAVDHEAVVEIAAHGARRLEHRGELETPVSGKRLLRIGQQSHLDAPRRIDLAAHVRRLVAQLPALPLRLGKRSHHGAAEDGHRPDCRPGEIEEHVEVAEGDDPHAQQQQYQAHHEVDPLQRGQARDEHDEDQPTEDEGRGLEADREVRAHQRHAVEEILDHLRVDLHARNELAQRRALVVEHAQSGDADENDLVAQALRIHLAAQDLEGRHAAIVVALRIAQPRRAVILQLRFHIREAHRDEAAARSVEAHSRADRNPKRFHAEGRHDHALHALHQRHHANDLILRTRVHQAAPGGGGIDDGQAADPVGIVVEALGDALVGDDHGLGTRRRGEARIDIARGDPEHHVLAADRLGENLVVGRHGFERARDVRRQDRDLGGDRRGRKAIRLGEQQVQPDRGGLVLPDARDQLGDARARPRPLPEVGERGLVDDHDRHRLGHALEREEALVAVEDDVAQRLRGRGHQQEKRQRGEEHQGQDPQAAQCFQRSISRPS